MAHFKIVEQSQAQLINLRHGAIICAMVVMVCFRYILSHRPPNHAATPNA